MEMKEGEGGGEMWTLGWMEREAEGFRRRKANIVFTKMSSDEEDECRV